MKCANISTFFYAFHLHMILTGVQFVCIMCEMFVNDLKIRYNIYTVYMYKIRSEEEI